MGFIEQITLHQRTKQINILSQQVLFLGNNRCNILTLKAATVNLSPDEQKELKTHRIPLKMYQLLNRFQYDSSLCKKSESKQLLNRCTIILPHNSIQFKEFLTHKSSTDFFLTTILKSIGYLH